MVEFALAGIASLTMLISTVHLSLGMWNYHTLAYATHEGTRWLAVRGKGCTNPGNTCSVSVGTIAATLRDLAIGVPPDSVSVTLTTDSGAQTVCNPLTSCYSDTTVWPPATNGDNRVGRLIKLEARYQYRSALGIVWPGATPVNFGTIIFPATSTQTIIF